MMGAAGARTPSSGRRVALLVLTTLLGSAWGSRAGAAGAAPTGHEAVPAEDFAEVSLGVGLSAGFGMLRLGGEGKSPSFSLGGHVITRTDAVVRVLVDDASGSAFGYRLEAAPLSSTLFGVIRVDIRPLTGDDEKQLKRLAACPTCPPPHLVAAFSPTRFPPTQIVRAGDAMVINLLVRPGTDEKIVDVVKFAFATVSQDELNEVRARIAEAFRHVRAGEDLLARRSVPAAAAEFAKAVALQPDPATHLRLAQCYREMDRPDLAQREYESALRINSTDADTWHSLGVLLHRRGLFGKAVNSYERVLKIKPEWALARRNLATAHLDRAELAPAFMEYREAHRSNPAILESKDASCVLARDPALQRYVFAKVYAAEGEIDSALASLRKAKDAGFRDLERVKEDAEFKPFLDDPRLVALVSGTSHS